MSSQNMTTEEIYGRRTWNLLHSMAAYYPENPDTEKQKAARDFLEGFMSEGIEYPEWGEHFLHRMNNENPLDLTDRESFSVWVCKQHNLFNIDFKKP